MDKIYLTVADVERLEFFKKRHPNEVRKMPYVFGNIKIIFKDPQRDVIIIAKRDRKKVEFRISCFSVLRDVFFVRIIDGGYTIEKIEKESGYEIRQEAASLYFALCAMVAAGRPIQPPKEKKPTNSPRKPQKQKTARGPHITYIFRKSAGRAGTGTRKNKPRSYCYSVRGHWRHCKSGKVVWIKEHWCCADKPSKGKTYKLN